MKSNFQAIAVLVQQQAELAAHASAPLNFGGNEGVAHHRSSDLDGSPSGLSPPSGTTYAQNSNRANALGSQGRAVRLQKCLDFPFLLSLL